MSENFNKLFTTQYSANLQLRLQQQGSRLRGLVQEGFHVGKQASPVDYVGPVQLKAPAGRFAPLNRQDSDFMRRWVFPQDGEIPQLLDKFDTLKSIEDPKSKYVVNAANAVARGWDDAIIAAAFGTAQIGTDNASLSNETFDTTNYGVSETFGNGSTSIGLTIEKLIEADRIFRHNHVDLDDTVNEEKTLIVGSQQEADLKKIAQVVSDEFNPGNVVMRDGRITRLMGWNIRFSERLSYGTGIGGSANTRKCIGFVKSGLYLGIWLDMINDVDIRKDLSGHPWQIYTMVSFGATRLEPGRVIRIDCGNDTTGGDITL